MSSDTGCCARISILKHVLRALVILLCVSVTGYLYLCNVKGLSIEGAHGWFKMINSNLSHTNSTSTPHEETLDIPLLTLFTTWPGNEPKYNARNNITLRNWARFKPKIRPVFFFPNGSDIDVMLQHGWDILPVSRTAAVGAPVLKTMFLDVMKKYQSRLYGYSNGDILYDKGILKTLEGILSSKLPEKKPVLIVGRRTNIPNITMKDTNNIDDFSALAKRGSLFSTWAEDYFITDRSFPWESIPGLVIGRRAYDNFLVLHSCKQKFTVIDATKTMLAIHQTTASGNHESHHRPKTGFNAGLLYSIYKNISFVAGITKCTPWFTYMKDRKIIVKKRAHLLKVCYKP